MSASTELPEMSDDETDSQLALAHTESRPQHEMEVPR